MSLTWHPLACPKGGGACERVTMALTLAHSIVASTLRARMQDSQRHSGCEEQNVTISRHGRRSLSVSTRRGGDGMRQGLR